MEVARGIKFKACRRTALGRRGKGFDIFGFRRYNNGLKINN
jgi:hypothetical protein